MWGEGCSCDTPPTLIEFGARQVAVALAPLSKESKKARTSEEPGCVGLNDRHGRQPEKGKTAQRNSRNGVWGRGCDEAEISEEKLLFTEWGPGIQ